MGNGGGGGRRIDVGRKEDDDLANPTQTLLPRRNRSRQLEPKWLQKVHWVRSLASGRKLLGGERGGVRIDRKLAELSLQLWWQAHTSERHQQ